MTANQIQKVWACLRKGVSILYLLSDININDQLQCYSGIVWFLPNHRTLLNTFLASHTESSDHNFNINLLFTNFWEYGVCDGWLIHWWWRFTWACFTKSCVQAGEPLVTLPDVFCTFGIHCYHLNLWDITVQYKVSLWYLQRCFQMLVFAKALCLCKLFSLTFLVFLLKSLARCCPYGMPVKFWLINLHLCKKWIVFYCYQQKLKIGSF